MSLIPNFRKSVRSHRQSNPEFAAAPQERAFPEANLDGLGWCIGRAGHNKPCHKPLLRMIMPVACETIDFSNQWILIEDAIHAIHIDKNQFWFDCKREIKNLNVRNHSTRTINPKRWLKLQMLWFDHAFYIFAVNHGHLFVNFVDAALC